MTWKPLTVWKSCCISCLIWAFISLKNLNLFIFSSDKPSHNFDYAHCLNFGFPLYLFKIQVSHERIVVYWCLFSDLVMLPDILFLLNHDFSVSAGSPTGIQWGKKVKAKYNSWTDNHWTVEMITFLRVATSCSGTHFTSK